MSNIASLIFYISLFLISTLLMSLGNKELAPKTKIILGKKSLTLNPLKLLAVAIPILIAGFRGNVGTDYSNYVDEYNTAIEGGSYLEISFNIIANISHSLVGGPELMFIVFSAMTVIPVVLAIEKSSIVKKEYRWILWTLFLFVMFPQTFNLLRQGVSVALGFYLFVSIIESRKLISISNLITLGLAISFHTSALILIPLGYIAHLLNNKRKKSITSFIIFFTILALALFAVLPQVLSLLDGAWSSYLDKDTISRSVVPRSILIVFILGIFWKYYDILKVTNSYTALTWTGALFSIGGLFVAYFERAGYYTTLLLPLLMLVIIAQSVPRRQTIVINAIVLVFGLAYFIGVYYLLSSSDIFPYTWATQQ